MIISLRHKADWMLLATLAGGAGILLWASGLGSPDTLAVNLKWLGLLVLVVGAAMLMHRRVHRQDIESLRKQLEHIYDEPAFGQVLVDRHVRADEETAPLNQSLSVLGKEMEEMKLANRTLEIRRQIADSQKRQTEEILELISDGVVVTNRFDELIFANESAERLLGFHLTDSLRKNIDEVISDGALARVIREAREMGLNQPRRVVEQTFDSSHSPLTFSIMLCCIPGPGGGLCGVVAVLHDITREKQIEHGKNEFVSNVSHELKTPLASIKAYTEMLLDGEVADPAGRREFYETIAGEAERLHRMIDRILSVSRIESGGVTVAREPVSMTAVAKQIMGVVAHQIQAKKLDLEQHLPPVYYQVEADYDLLCQAVLNLLTNAIKYTPAGGTIRLEATVDERRGVATIKVSDTGIGIPADELPKIFDKFYRVRANMKMAPGTGLGLPLVKYIVETIHGAKLSVTSEPQKGSTFSFELPLVK